MTPLEKKRGKDKGDCLQPLECGGKEWRRSASKTTEAPGKGERGLFNPDDRKKSQAVSSKSFSKRRGKDETRRPLKIRIRSRANATLGKNMTTGSVARSPAKREKGRLESGGEGRKERRLGAGTTRAWLKLTYSVSYSTTKGEKGIGIGSNKEEKEQ